MSAELVAHLTDLLRDTRWADSVCSRRMFGGYGIYVDGVFCALIADDTLYLKTDEESRAAFVERDLKPFTYRKNGEDLSMSYHQAPAEALEEGSELAGWIAMAVAAARRAVAKKRKRTRVRKSAR